MNVLQGRKLTRLKTQNNNFKRLPKNSSSGIYLGGQSIVFNHQAETENKQLNLPKLTKNVSSNFPSFTPSIHKEAPLPVTVISSSLINKSLVITRAVSPLIVIQSKPLELSIVCRRSIITSNKEKPQHQSPLSTFFLTPSLKKQRFQGKLKGLNFQTNVHSNQFDDSVILSQSAQNSPKKQTFIRSSFQAKMSTYGKRLNGQKTNFSDLNSLIEQTIQASPGIALTESIVINDQEMNIINELDFDIVEPQSDKQLAKTPHTLKLLVDVQVDEQFEVEMLHENSNHKNSKIKSSTPSSSKFSKNSFYRVNDPLAPIIPIHKIIQRDSFMSSQTFESNGTSNDEEYDVWDNGKDVRVAQAVNDHIVDKTEIQQFLKFYKIRYGGFPGLPQSISNEQVIEVAVRFATQNKRLFRKYFPNKQVEFDDQNDYSTPYDSNDDANYHQFQQFCTEQSPNTPTRLNKPGNRGSLNQIKQPKESQFKQLDRLQGQRIQSMSPKLSRNGSFKNQDGDK